MPPLGCGEGQLDWHVVGPVLVRKLSEFNIDVELYAPLDATDRGISASGHRVERVGDLHRWLRQIGHDGR